MASKLLLPVLGGTPAVWTTAVFSFQLILLAGYGYAHLLTRMRRAWVAWALHGLFFLLSLSLLPLNIILNSTPEMLASPALHVMFALFQQLGLPFLLLSATQPLLQTWLVRARIPHAAQPQVFYSASNLGSFVGLLGYVVVIEPLLNLDHQRWVWSTAYVLGMAVFLLTGMGLIKLNAVPLSVSSAEPRTKLPWKSVGKWLWLTFLASSLSLGVTTYVTTDVASMPLLWIIPLAIYLLSFVDAFQHKPLLVPYCQRIAPWVALGALGIYMLHANQLSGIYFFHFIAFGVLAFALHGWLSSHRPDGERLTLFYLCISVGGAFGGLLNGFLAPLLLRDALEYPVILAAAALTLQMLHERAPHPLRVIRQTAWRIIYYTIPLYVLFLLIYSAKFDQFSQTALLDACGIATLSVFILHRTHVRAVYCGPSSYVSC